MFERFTEQARQVIVLAQDEARALKHDHIGVEHLLLCLFRVEENRTRELLDSAGVSADEIRAKVQSSVGMGDEAPSDQIPFTPRAKKTLELALREALARGDNDYIGPEHILFGLTAAVGVPRSSLEADVDRVREGIARILSGPSDRPPAQAGIAGILSGHSNRPPRVVAHLETPWRKRAELDLRVFGAIVAATFAIGLLVGWAIWGH